MRFKLSCSVLLVGLMGLAAPVVTAQGRPGAADDGLPAPQMSQAVLRLLEADYLTDAEKARARVFHGVWKQSDLNDPAMRARAALVSGVLNDPSLDDPAADAEDRAEARLLRGDLDGCLALLEGAASPRSIRIRASALEELGRFAEADAAIEPIVQALTARQAAPAELNEGVRAMIIRARLQGRPADDYERMIGLLSHVHQTVDRLYWPAMLTEARLLADKDNYTDAIKAAEQVLTLNPQSADAWRLIGELSIASFNLPAADQIATRLDRMVRRFSDDDSATSPWADIIRARSRMRQNDPEQALEFLGRTLERFPTMRDALAFHAAATAMLYDFQKTDELLARFDALSPRSPSALLAVGRALAEARQYAESAHYLELARDLQPNLPTTFIELGLMEMQAGRDAHAHAALSRAVELDPFNIRARNSLRLLNDLAAHETLESDHFIVRFKPGIDNAMARDMLGPLENIHRIVCGIIEHEPSVKTLIDLMPDHATFAVRITGMPAVHTIAAATGPVIAMEAPREGPRSKGSYDWVRVIRHEYAHTVTLSRTNNRIPHWFTEAAAVYVEDSPIDYPTAQMLVRALETGALFDMQEINIAFVRPKKPSDRAQAYAQGHWMYRYIVDRWGASAPLRLMDLYAHGMREDRAMREILGVSQEDFHTGFVAWARRDAATWGMLPSPTIGELRLKATLEDQESSARLLDAIGQLARVAGAPALAGIRPSVTVDELPLIAVTPELVDYWAIHHPDHPDVLELLVDEEVNFFGGKATESTADLLERYARARPVDPMPHRLLAQLYLDSEDPARAVPHLEYLDAREQYAATYAVELARRYAALGEWDTAWAKAIRATQVAPYNAAYRELAATIAIRRHDLPAAIHQIEALVILEPNQPRHAQRLEAVKRMMAES